MASHSKVRRTWAILRLFSGFFMEIAWYKLLRNLKGDQVEARLPQIYRNQAVRFRDTALNLEGLLIKVGQFFSTRVDVLPKEYTSELALLQDEVPPVSSAAIKDVIAAELGEPVERAFTQFDDTPIAAASLGQVHRAVLPTGETVAVKVLRPGIEEIIEIDLRAFRGVIWMLKVFTDWKKFADFDAIYSEFTATVREELNYRQEYANIERFRDHFKDEPQISVPIVYPNTSRQRVLTLEFVEGFKVTDHESMLAAGLDLIDVAGTLVNAYLKQALIDGFYHADPHPGNLFIRPDGGIIFIDFGMVGRITEADKRSVRKLISGIINSQPQELAQALQEMGFIKPSVNLMTLQKAIALFLDELKGISFEELGNLQVDRILEELREFIYAEPFQIPAHYTFLGRAVGTLSGIAAGLDPDMNILEMIKPYARQILDQDLSAAQLIWQKTKNVAKAAIDIPPLLERTLKDLQLGDVQVKMEMGPILRQLRFQETLANRLIWAILLAGTGISIAVLWSNGQEILVRKLMYLIGFFSLLLLNNFRQRAEKRLKIHTHPHRRQRS